MVVDIPAECSKTNSTKTLRLVPVIMGLVFGSFEDEYIGVADLVKTVDQSQEIIELNQRIQRLEARVQEIFRSTAEPDGH